jgi:hypothetical protein
MRSRLMSVFVSVLEKNFQMKCLNFDPSITVYIRFGTRITESDCEIQKFFAFIRRPYL